jgi:acyl-CoA synthetase (NDP forming)
MSLSNIFDPQSIAVIGASSQEGSVGNSLFKNLLDGFVGKVYPVNPKSVEILGKPCFVSIENIPVVPDLAIIIVPAKVVPIVLQQVADKGVKGVVIISAGFKEIGGEGVELENQVKEICIANNISLIGPNCLGVINPWISMNGSFANSVPPKGNVAFLSQSGAICTAVIDYAQKLDLGFSKFVSVGNKALSSEVEMIKYLEQDPQTDVISIYAEGLTNAAEIIETMKNITKPVVILKSGRTAAGSGASSSHTGALASEDVLYEALFRQAGIHRAENIKELFEYMKVLSRYNKSEKLKVKSEKVENKLTSIRHSEGLSEESHLEVFENTNISSLSNNGTGSFAPLKMTGVLSVNKPLQVAIITNAGGPGVLTTDYVIQNGMELAQISTESMEKLKLRLPPTANFHNPFDLIGDAPAQRYQDALEVLTKDENVDAIIVILTPQTTTQIDETASLISKYASQTNKPIIVSFIGGNKVLSGVEILRQNDVVHIDFPESAARALSVLKSEKLKVKSEKSISSGCHSESHSEESHLDGFEISNGDTEAASTTSRSYLYNTGTGSFAPLKMTSFSDARQKAQVIFDEYKIKNQYYIPEVDAKKIFELYNIPTVKSVYCECIKEVEEKVQQTFGVVSNTGTGSFAPLKMTNILNLFQRPPKSQTQLILKIISPDVMHKSDVGGIIANVSIENAPKEYSNMMKNVQSKLPDAKLEGVLFSQMIDLSAGVEFILGAKKDPSLGTAIMFGLGGTMVELIHDVVFGFGKLGRQDILEMIDQLKSKKIIDGYRGKSPLDLEAIITTIEGLSNMLADFPSITEVDMNPVLVGYNQSGVKVLDAKIVFE